MTGLVVIPLRPERVLRSHHVESPAALLEQGVSAVLHRELGDAEVVLDFGKERVGYFTMDVESAGQALLSVRYGESVEELAADLAGELPWYRYPRDKFAVGAGVSSLESRGRRAFRYVQVGVARGGAPVHLANTVLLHRHAPVRRRGHFCCSDDQLNRIWDISAYTTELCMQDYYEDGIKRDGLLWIGDARVQFLCGYHAFGDAALAGRSLRMIAASQRADGALPACAAVGGGHQHPGVIDYMPGVTDGVGRWIIDNYCTDFLGALRDYHDYTGDLALVRELWPCALQTAAYLAGVPLDPPVAKNIITDENVRVKDSWWPSAGTFLLQLVGGLRDMAACAAALGDSAAHLDCLRRSDGVERIVRARYRSPRTGAFTDVAATAGVVPELSWHANAFAVLVGAGGADEQQLEVVAADKGAGYPIAGFMKYWVLEAMMQAGLLEEAVRDVRAYWGFMLDHGATTCWEKLDLGRPANVLSNPAVSRCHGWSAGPCVLFPRHLLGVRPARPGFARVMIRPFLPAGVTWMEGTVPTPCGEIFVRWERGRDRLSGCVVLPPGMEGDFYGHGTKVVPLRPGTANVIDEEQPA